MKAIMKEQIKKKAQREVAKDASDKKTHQEVYDQREVAKDASEKIAHQLVYK